MAIPKIIHQLWIGNKPVPTNDINTWKNAHPNWQHKLWRESDIDKLDLPNRKQYDLMPELCGKKDIVQWYVLQEYGGFFIDADSECINPLDDLIDNDFVAAYENEADKLGLIANGVVGCGKGHIVAKKCNDIISTYNEMLKPAWKMTGPTLLTFVINEYMPDYAPMHQNTFYPFHYSGKNIKDNSVKIYANNYWMSTFGGREKIKKLNINIMNCKYRFKQQYVNQTITYRTIEGDKVNITAFNLTDTTAEMILNDPHRSHILEKTEDAVLPKKKVITLEPSVVMSASISQEVQNDGNDSKQVQEEQESKSSESKRKRGRPKISE